MAKCSIEAEQQFGPSADCYGGFDFTLFFEETILTITPTAIVLLLLPFFIYGLWKHKAKVSQTWHHGAKLVGTTSILVCTVYTPNNQMFNSANRQHGHLYLLHI